MQLVATANAIALKMLHLRDTVANADDATRQARTEDSAAMELFDILPPPPPIGDRGRRLPISSTSNRPFWCRRASTSIRAPAPGTMPRCCSAKQGFQDAVERVALARLSARASPWWRSWSKACCGPQPATIAGECSTRSFALVLSVFDRYPVPAALGEEPGARRAPTSRAGWSSIGLHPPKRAMDIPEPFAETIST